MRVTVLTLTNNGDVSVGRLRRRGVRSGVNQYVNGGLNDDQVERLKGELAFVLSIEPNSSDTLLRAYGSTALTEICLAKLFSEATLLATVGCELVPSAQRRGKMGRNTLRAMVPRHTGGKINLCKHLVLLPLGLFGDLTLN